MRGSGYRGHLNTFSPRATLHKKHYPSFWYSILPFNLSFVFKRNRIAYFEKLLSKHMIISSGVSSLTLDLSQTILQSLTVSYQHYQMFKETQCETFNLSAVFYTSASCVDFFFKCYVIYKKIFCSSLLFPGLRPFSLLQYRCFQSETWVHIYFLLI